MKLYVDWQFLENLFLSEMTDQNSYLKKFLSRSQKGVEIILNVDIDAAYADPDKKGIIRQVANKMLVTNVTFLSACQFAAFHQSGVPALFFVDSVPLPIDRLFGCFAISSNKLEEADWLFYAESFRIDRTQRDWSLLKKIKHPCNTLIITDNYLLVNDKEYKNTISILSQLMPKTLAKDFSFHITIIGYSSKDFTDIQKQAKEIRIKLRELFDYTINLNIIREDYHGRYIHTNYYRIFSEKGFALFRNERIRPDDETSVDCQPLTMSGRYTSILTTRTEELKKCVAIQRTDRMPDKLAGDKIIGCWFSCFLNS